MSLEIERKWRVTSPPALQDGAPLQQGYLSIGADEVRVRKKSGKARLTVKQGQGLVRRESEIALTDAQFDALWPLTEGRRIEKVRYRVAHDGHTIEVDVYAGTLDGLVTAEVEFPDTKAAAAFHGPEWFGSELTGAPGWSNARLAVDGIPEAEP